ncbi:hypothetical protein [Cellulomonas sp. URHB0016]
MPDDILVLHALRVLGHGTTAQVAARFGLPPGPTAEHLLDAQACGWVGEIPAVLGGGWSLTEAGKARGEHLLAVELDGVGGRAALAQVYDDFLPHNVTVTQACTSWQLAGLGLGPAVRLDEVLARLTVGADALLSLERRLVAIHDRFGGYHRRFADAVAAARTDSAWVTATGRDSCHQVWFELHEDLIASLGLTR